MKRALITGITGMDGSHMADLLLSKGYEVYGMERHKSVPNRTNIKHIEEQIHFVKGDLTDFNSLVSVLEESEPDEVYNFAAQAFDGDSWKLAEMTSNVTGLGVLRLLDAIRTVNKKIKIQQASSSGMYGKTAGGIINESHPFKPHSPYASAKVFAHHAIQNFRDTYGIFACASICFTHESEQRGFEFVTRKISSAAARISLGLQKQLKLGTITTERDWGYAPDYCEGFWLMLQQPQPEDYIFATGEAYSVEDFLDEAFFNVGIPDWDSCVVFDKSLVRLAEIPCLLGDATKAKTSLGWKPKVKFEELVARMVQNDIRLNQNKNNDLH